ncbi:MAG: S9 family peptidase [Steroidobacteraceae bacterium]
MRGFLVLVALGATASAATQGDKQFDAAAAFGSRPSVSSVSVSPDGGSIAFIAPSAGQGSSLYTLRLDANPHPRPALVSDGKPFRLQSCEWVSNSRLICTVFGLQKVNLELVPFTRLVAVDADGSNLKLLSTRQGQYARGLQLYGGELLDLLPDEDGIVLMARVYIPEDHLGSHVGSTKRGLGVDRIDTRTLQSTSVEPPHDGAVSYITDGRGNVRIMGLQVVGNSRGQLNGMINYLYRTSGSSEWRALGDYDTINRTGFQPVSVDPDQNAALGYKKKDGRLALYKVALDGSMREELIYERPDVDVGGLIQIGRRHRTVGVGYATDRAYAFYFDTTIEAVHASLGRALPNQPELRIIDSSVDESKLLILAGSDNDAGAYYLFDRTARQVRPLLAVREALNGVSLASVKSVQYPAADGTMIPAYLTLPPGRENARGLPAIVMPHGGPSSRDFWGFNWLAQFFASRGFAVLQPNYRGSSGFGDIWFEKNGFRSWPIAIGDVLDAGRWLVAQGIADGGKLAIVGWSYGGYAALQSAVVEPSLFKAVVGIAPVTDLNALKEEHRHWTDFELIEQFVGEGSHLRDGSPLPNAARIKVPVLLFHGTLDRNVGYQESERMAAALSAAHDRCELVTFENLDHQLEDSEAREQMLRKSDAFLREVMGL